MRAVAAFLVLMTHAGAESGAIQAGIPGRFLAHADVGVAIFFVLSGFLLSRGWVRAVQAGAARPSLRRYFTHRTARIIPAYWAALLVILVTVGGGATAATIISNVTLTQTYTGLFLPRFFVTWSLCTEVAFYLALPLLAPLLIRRSRRTSLLLLAAVGAIGPLWLYLIKGPLVDSLPGVAATWLPGHLDWFCAGMALALLETALRSDNPPLPGITRRPWLLAAVAAAVYAVAMTPITGQIGIFAPRSPAEHVAQELLYCMFSFLVILALLVPRSGATVWGRALDSGFMEWFGRLSYMFFLLHSLVLFYVREFLGLPFEGGGFLISILATTVLTLVVAQASWVALERPALRWAGAVTADRNR
jgi:peptidoglycan/LPS O-acetylase OafA/YrhL